MTTDYYLLDDRYQVHERIATGGQGEVWRGVDQILGRPVAIKMLSAAHAQDNEYRARFRAEARYASSLAHPGITRVFDYGEHSPLGGPYLVMELVDGQPLAEILERYGRLDPYVVLDVLAQAARALDAAHRAGIVHRDIKPGNLLIMPDGTTKITDFGIAKANGNQRLTPPGMVMGAAVYVSPEQATGQPLTGASDVYSLGVAAYECLAGDPPFNAGQPLDTAAMHVHDPVPPLPADVPRPVADLVYAMLAKEPGDRPESAREVADRAEVILEARRRPAHAGPDTSGQPAVTGWPPAPPLTTSGPYQPAGQEDVPARGGLVKMIRARRPKPAERVADRAEPAAEDRGLQGRGPVAPGLTAPAAGAAPGKSLAGAHPEPAHSPRGYGPATDDVAVIEVAIRHGRRPGTFEVEIVSSPAGEATAAVTLDVDDLLARRERLQWAVLASAVARRRILPETERPVVEIGKLLFRALLGSGEVAGRYRAAAAVAADRGQRLRVLLRIDDPTLAALPWEAMYDEAAGAYVCRQDQLVRHLGVASMPLPLAVRAPLRILGIVASPRGLPALDTEREQEHLVRALDRPVRQGLVELHWVPAATWSQVHGTLLEGPWHVVHFIGHGDFDPARDEGFLSLVGEDGRSHRVPAHRMVDLLREGNPTPRLVVLNSCLGAQASTSDLFSGTAAALVRGGISAVAAMQYEISDAAAAEFARGFYTAIANGRGLDKAVSSGRVAILGTSDHTLEWLTPVLYLRGRETNLFDVQ